MKKLVLKIGMTALFIAMFSCSGKKGHLLVIASGSEAATYSAVFGKYFNVKVGEPSGERYLLFVNRNVPEDLKDSSSFLISLNDAGSNVNVEIYYTVGAKSANATIINPNMSAGKISTVLKFSITPEDVSDPVSRVQLVATVISEQLSKIEEKKSNY